MCESGRCRRMRRRCERKVSPHKTPPREVHPQGAVERRDRRRCEVCRDCFASQKSLFSRDLRFTTQILHDPPKSQFLRDRRSKKMKEIVNSYDLTIWIAILTIIMFLLKCTFLIKLSQKKPMQISIFLILVPMLIT